MSSFLKMTFPISCKNYDLFEEKNKVADFYAICFLLMSFIFFQAHSFGTMFGSPSSLYGFAGTTNVNSFW